MRKHATSDDLTTKTCLHCGKAFGRNEIRDRRNYNLQVFCSSECYQASRYRGSDSKTCENCGRSFLRSECRDPKKFHIQINCSQSCLRESKKVGSPWRSRIDKASSLRKDEFVSPPESDLRSVYEIEGLSTRAIGKKYGVSHNTVAKWFGEHGIAIHSTRTRSRRLAMVEPSKDELRAMLEVEVLTGEQIARRCKASVGLVRGWMKKHGLQSKTPPGFMRRYYKSKNGESVRSTYEARVADWLFDHNQSYVYEPKVPFDSRCRADFSVNGWFIEIWGVTECVKYTAQRHRKTSLYKDHAVPLIQIERWHFAQEATHILESRLQACLSPIQSPLGF